jgi:hypothetical protein
MRSIEVVRVLLKAGARADLGDRWKEVEAHAVLY